MAIQQTRNVATDEASSLISSDKVEGTEVYNRQGEKLGSIHSVMIDKVSGKVAYAVMSFGGFLGMGRPLPPPALARVDLRYRPGRLRGGSRPEQARGGADP
jgi:PRC-barrel domain